MLVLGRLVGERVRLTCPDGTVIWVTVTHAERGKARIGFDAPRGVQVFREEVAPRLPPDQRKDATQ